jgi:hypothetical protein
MTPEIEALTFDELRTLHREIGALIAQRRHEALEQLKTQMELLGFTPEDFAPPRKKRGRKPRQQQEEDLTEHIN